MLDLNNLEQPKNARSWHTPTLEAIEGYDAIFDQFNVLLDAHCPMSMVNLSPSARAPSCDALMKPWPLT